MPSFSKLKPSAYLTDTSKAFDERLLAFETLIAHQLPGNYVRFLRKHDATLIFGVDVEYQPVVSSPWATKTGQQSLEVLCGLTKGREGLTKMYRAYGSQLPSDTIPIGCAAGGNVITLTLAGPHAFEVSLWDHEHEPASTGNHDAWGSLYLAALNFDDFLERLHVAEKSDNSSSDGIIKSRLSPRLIEIRRRELEGQ